MDPSYNSPLLGDASAARAASTSSCYAITKHNAVLTNHHFQCPLTTSGLSWRWNSTALLPPLSLPFANALCAVGRTKTGARRRTVCVRPCHRLLHATTKRRTRGIMSSLEELSSRGPFFTGICPPPSGGAERGRSGAAAHGAAGAAPAGRPRTRTGRLADGSAFFGGSSWFLHHAFFGPGTTVEPFCRLEKLGDRPIFTCLQT